MSDRYRKLAYSVRPVKTPWGVGPIVSWNRRHGEPWKDVEVDVVVHEEVLPPTMYGTYVIDNGTGRSVVSCRLGDCEPVGGWPS